VERMRLSYDSIATGPNTPANIDVSRLAAGGITTWRHARLFFTLLTCSCPIAGDAIALPARLPRIFNHRISRTQLASRRDRLLRTFVAGAPNAGRRATGHYARRQRNHTPYLLPAPVIYSSYSRDNNGDAICASLTYSCDATLAAAAGV